MLRRRPCARATRGGSGGGCHKPAGPAPRPRSHERTSQQRYANKIPNVLPALPLTRARRPGPSRTMGGPFLLQTRGCGLRTCVHRKQEAQCRRDTEWSACPRVHYSRPRPPVRRSLCRSGCPRFAHFLNGGPGPAVPRDRAAASRTAHGAAPGPHPTACGVPRHRFARNRLVSAPSPPPPPRVTFRRVVAPLRGPEQSPVLPFACCVASLLSVGRGGRCSCWCRFRVRGAQ